MQDLSKLSLSQLRKLEGQVAEELKKRHYLGISRAREQILHIAQGAGLSVDQLLSPRRAKAPAGEPAAAKYRHPDDATLGWSGRGRQPGWVKAWTAAGKSLDEIKVGSGE